MNLLKLNNSYVETEVSSDVYELKSITILKLNEIEKNKFYRTLLFPTFEDDALHPSAESNMDDISVVSEIYGITSHPSDASKRIWVLLQSILVHRELSKLFSVSLTNAELHTLPDIRFNKNSNLLYIPDDITLLELRIVLRIELYYLGTSPDVSSQKSFVFNLKLDEV